MDHRSKIRFKAANYDVNNIRNRRIITGGKSVYEGKSD
jgi:hypothetical protein